MRVLLDIPLSTYSGYGNDGIGLTRAMLRAGVDVYLSPTVAQPPLPEEVALLLTKELQTPFDLIIKHVDPDSLSLNEQERTAGQTIIGWTMWEYTNLRNSEGVDTLRERLKLFDAIVCYDQVTQEAFREFYDGPLPIVQGGFWPEDWEFQERDWTSDRFGFCLVGALHSRKDPFVAIDAFRELKEEKGEAFEGAELHLKTNIQTLHPELENFVPKLRIHYAVWSNEVLKTFYSKQHVLISSSRGEGKNMPALEFQSTGGAVIVTDWGGHKEWLSENYGYGLDYVLRPVSPEFPTTFNARASKDHLKELMWHAYTHRDEVEAKATLASEIIPEKCSWDSVVKNLFYALEDQVQNGPQLWQDFDDLQVS